MTYPIRFDKAAAAVVAKIPTRLNSPMRYISILGGTSYAVGTLLIVFSWVMLTGRTELLPYVMVTAVFIPLAEMLKFITRRPRPETFYAQNMKFKSYSFPSGHAYVSALISGFIIGICSIVVPAPLNLLAAMTAAVWSGLVGVSRIYLGAHFPSDVFAGWALGVLVQALLITVLLT